jgi:hypothetical protein
MTALAIVSLSGSRSGEIETPSPTVLTSAAGCLSAPRHRPKSQMPTMALQAAIGPAVTVRKLSESDGTQRINHRGSVTLRALTLKELQQPSSRALTLITAVLRTFNARHKRIGVYRFVRGIPVGWLTQPSGHPDMCRRT